MHQIPVSLRQCVSKRVHGRIRSSPGPAALILEGPQAFLENIAQGQADREQMRADDDEATSGFQHPNAFLQGAAGIGHMFQNLIHGHGLEARMVKGESLNIRRDVRNGWVDLPRLQRTGMKVGSPGIQAFLPEQEGAPAIAASYIESSPGWLGDMRKNESHVTPVMPSRFIKIACELSPNMLGRMSIEGLHRG